MWTLWMWKACLWLAVKGTGATPRLTKIKIDPAAALVFPSAQLSGACGITTIEGLGVADGDYTLLDDPSSSRPAWIGTSPYIQHLVLSYLQDEGVWAIGGNNLFHAFLRVDAAMPPVYSSLWQVFDHESSAFHGSGKVVSISCPACSAVVVSTLPQTLATCDGPYRFHVANSEAGAFMWSHVSDERCTMLHDKAGNSVISMEKPATLDQAMIAAVAQGAEVPEEWWAGITREAGKASSAGQGGNVVCTSAGQTTRIVLDLMEPGQRNVVGSSGGNNDAVRNIEPNTSNVESFRLSSLQDGSIISSSYNFFHIRVSRNSRKVELAQGPTVGNLADLPNPQTTASGAALTEEKHINITVGGIVAPSVSLERASTEGVLLSVEGRAGTWVFEICLFQTSVRVSQEKPSDREEGCLAETVLILEIFSADTQIVHRRRSTEVILSSGGVAGGLEAAEGDYRMIRVVFLVDLKVVDGYKLSTLHLMKHLPSNFRASTLDLSCASGELPVHELFDKEGFEVVRLCTKLLRDTWDLAQREGVSMNTFVYSALLDSATWNDVVFEYPDIAQALGDLYCHLATFDVLVMSNGAMDADAYLLHVARLAGVGSRVVNLGATAGGYVSPLFSGATTLVGPSHYVAHNAAVIRNAGSMPVKVCHPVMDAARVLGAARSCEANVGQVPESDRHTFELPNPKIDAAGHGQLRPATFVMVGRLSTEKTPGIFLRAMAVLERRSMTWGEPTRRTEGVVVGKGPLLPHMETLARSLNATVRFTGFLPVDTVPCEVQRACAVVVPSTSADTFGMVGPEAMLLGVPLVTFGFGGTGELVRHMENGILVAEPTPKMLADALELLATDQILRDRLGAQARVDALGALSLPEMVACHTIEFMASAK